MQPVPVRPIRRIALLEPLGDIGIGIHAYELAKALVADGLEVDVYTNGDPWTASLPRASATFPVLGSALVRQRRRMTTQRTESHGGDGRPAWQRSSRPRRVPAYLGGMRDAYLAVELAAWLRARRYDVVWTQWPDMGHGLVKFWAAARLLGLPVVHTAHNVLPHEGETGDRARYGRVYRQSRAIVVHSESARRALVREYPSSASKIVVSPLGLYTVYPRRPEVRDSLRLRLGIPPDATTVLFFGGVRPYKNVDSVIQALAAERTGRLVLVVAGWEFGYPDSDRADPLGRTRRLAISSNVQDRVRFVAGPFGCEATSELFEGSDIVVLPYLESSGSGVLLLAMSFGKHVVATRSGGMDEYLAGYPGHVLLEGTGGAEVVSALHRAEEMILAGGGVAPARPPQLEWKRIVQELVPQLARHL
jgi:glycosyltransferase involved in cell wall biosynthesis